MKNQFAAVMTSAALLLSGQLITAPVEAKESTQPATVGKVTPRCWSVQRTGTKFINDGSPGKDDWVLKANVLYDYCDVLRGPDYVQLHYGIYGYNFESKKQRCGGLFGFDNIKYVSFNGYFVGRGGVNYNPPRVKLKCDEDTKVSVMQIYSMDGDQPRLYFDDEDDAAAGDPTPRARFRVHGEKWNLTDTWNFDTTIKMRLRPCSGVGTEHCP